MFIVLLLNGAWAEVLDIYKEFQRVNIGETIKMKITPCGLHRIKNNIMKCIKLCFSTSQIQHFWSVC